MKLTYVYDLKFDNDGAYFYAKNFSDTTWEKYLTLVDDITIYPYVKQVAASPLPAIKSPLMIVPLPFTKTRQLYQSPKKTWQLADDIARNSDGVLIRLPSHLGTFVGLACLRLNKPYMVEVVGNAWEAYRLQGNPLYRLMAGPLQLSMKRLVRHASVAIYVTNDYLQRCYPSNGKAYTVPNATIHERRGERKEVQPFKIGMIGSMATKYKGHDTLFDALKRLDHYELPLHVSLLGEDPRPLPTYTHIEVTHEGILNQTQLKTWYESLSLYVQPSYTEAIGRSIMEAMSYQLPVIASDVGGIPELLDESSLFPVKDATSFAHKIAACFYDPGYRKWLGERNAQHVQQFHHTVATVKRAEAFSHYRNYCL